MGDTGYLYMLTRDRTMLLHQDPTRRLTLAANFPMSEVREPFFTTRMGQGGSGLGLSIAFNIATGMLGGTLELVSAQGQGTTFAVNLPRVAPNVTTVDR